MIDLDSIIDNLGEFESDVDRLAKLLVDNGVSFDTFMSRAKENYVSVKKSMREQLATKMQMFSEAQAAVAGGDEDAWAEAQQLNTESAYQDYLNNHLDGAHRDDARNAMAALRQPSPVSFGPVYDDSGEDNIAILDDIIKTIRSNKEIADPEAEIFRTIKGFIDSGKITREELIEAIREDNNYVSSGVANKLWMNNIIPDYSEAGIDPDFIKLMKQDAQSEKFFPARTLDRITTVPSTEVYFWGIPSSGKSCALGAILSAASSGKNGVSMLPNNSCQGYGYMTRLSEIFNPNVEVGVLPERTATTSTYEMGFTLTDSNKRKHPITCIDLAGELIRCMHTYDAGEPLQDEESEVLSTLSNILVDQRTDNRKIHFFVIEYGAEKRLYKGLSQKTYLTGALQYIQRTGIFKSNTDAVYILLTKIDKTKMTGEALAAEMKRYIQANYMGFYNGLKSICDEYEINGGQVQVKPFTLGKVCFQNFCKYSSVTAWNIVEELINRSYSYKPGKLNWLRNKLGE